MAPQRIDAVTQSEEHSQAVTRIIEESGVDRLFDAMMDVLDAKAQDAYDADDCDSAKLWEMMSMEVSRCAGRVARIDTPEVHDLDDVI